jgi:hypothetical protein
MNQATERIETRVIQIDPRQLKLLDLNARFMRHETFMRLVENVRADGTLTQIPFAWLLHDDDTQQPLLQEGEPVYEVLSGNHRVQAAISAELETIAVEVSDQYLDADRRKGIQLSHNELVGEDDPATLKTIYSSINDITMRVYSGLDDKKLDLLTDVETGALSEAALDFQTIQMVFLPDELEVVEETWEQAKKTMKQIDQVWLARFTDYDRFLDALEATSDAYGIKNTATSLMMVLEIFTRHLVDLQEGWPSPESKNKHAVPIVTAIGSERMAPDAARKVAKAIEQMLSRQEIEEGKPWQALERWADAYLVEE